MITFESGIYSILLPNPRLGDSEQLNIKTTFLMSMANTVFSYLRKPPNSKWLLSFTDLTDLEYANFITFLENTADLIIAYTDYNAVVWSGIFVNVPLVLETYGRRPCAIIPPPYSEEQEAHQVSVEFEYGPPFDPPVYPSLS